MITGTGPTLVVAVLLLVALGFGALLVGKVPIARQVPWAAVRAGVQLLVVSWVIGVVLADPWFSFAFLGLMFTVAVVTTARRTGLDNPVAVVAAAAAMGAGVVPVLAIIFGSGVAPLSGAAIVPIGGIIIGGGMTGHTLLGRQSFAALREGMGEYDAYLALGFRRHHAVRELVRTALPEALVPAVDQTRTVGLVTLPGAYVGVLLGGGSAFQAGAAQLLVLVGILATQAVTTVVARELTSYGWLLPTPLAQRLRH